MPYSKVLVLQQFILVFLIDPLVLFDKSDSLFFLVVQVFLDYGMVR